MSKKHYKLIAASLNEVRLSCPNDDGTANSPRHVLYTAVNNICTVLKQENPRFDRERFLTACGF